MSLCSPMESGISNTGTHQGLLLTCCELVMRLTRMSWLQVILATTNLRPFCLIATYQNHPPYSSLEMGFQVCPPLHMLQPFYLGAMVERVTQCSHRMFMSDGDSGRLAPNIDLSCIQEMERTRHSRNTPRYLRCAPRRSPFCQDEG
jgi:hypothetical protein